MVISWLASTGVTEVQGFQFHGRSTTWRRCCGNGAMLLMPLSSPQSSWNDHPAVSAAPLAGVNRYGLICRFRTSSRQQVSVPYWVADRYSQSLAVDRWNINCWRWVVVYVRLAFDQLAPLRPRTARHASFCRQRRRERNSLDEYLCRRQHCRWFPASEHNVRCSRFHSAIKDHSAYVAVAL